MKKHPRSLGSRVSFNQFGNSLYERMIHDVELHMQVRDDVVRHGSVRGLRQRDRAGRSERNATR
jgi:hypothetical protein